MLFLELLCGFLQIFGCGHSVVADTCRVEPRIMHKDLGVCVRLAPLFGCRHHDDGGHRCSRTVHDGGDFLARGAQPVIDGPAFQDVTTVAVDMHVDDIVLGWQGIAELVDVTKRNARLHAPHTGHGFLLFALDVVVDVKYCHLFSSF